MLTLECTLSPAHRFRRPAIPGFDFRRAPRTPTVLDPRPTAGPAPTRKGRPRGRPFQLMSAYAAISISGLMIAGAGASRWRTATSAATNPRIANRPATSKAELNPAVSALLIAARVGRPSASWFRDTFAATLPMIAMPNDPPS